MRKLLITKTASLLALLMIVSIMIPLIAFAQVGFKDVVYNSNGTVTGQVYGSSPLAATVSELVYLDVLNQHGTSFTVAEATYSSRTVTTDVYNTVTSSVYYYNFNFSVTEATYNPISLKYTDGGGHETVSGAVYKETSNGGGNGGNGSGNPSSDDEDQVNNGKIITVGNSVAKEALERAFADRDDITVEVKGDNVSLPAAALKDAAGNADASITVETDNGSYTLPLSALDFDALLGDLDVELEDLTIRVNVKKVADDVADAVLTRTKELDGEQVADAIDFEVIAEGKNGNTSSINSFGDTYVSRSIPLHASVDTDKTTGVVYDPETGEFSFVPTIFTEVNGQTIATLKRNSNSIYTVISVDKSFADVAADHWGKEDIDLLANKLIVAGITAEEFAPGQDIKRAEFASLLVRSLGLSQSATDTTFSDVDADAWYAADVAIAADAGLVFGYEDDTFRPDQAITREESAAMVVRAMNYAGTELELTEDEQSAALSAFSDSAEIRWGQDTLAAAIQAEIVFGMTEDTLAPTDNATRAQATAMLKRYLDFVGFIN